MKRIIALVLSLVLAVSLCISPAWGADEATEQAAQEFIRAYLTNDEGSIFGHVKGFDGSLGKMFASEGAWDALSDEAKARVNERLDVAYDGLSYETLLEWTQGFMFMAEHLVVAEGDYEGYIISTDPNGGTLVDPDPPQNTYAVHPFTHEIWQRIVDAEAAFNALSADAKAYLEKLMTEEGFGLNNGIQPAGLPVCNFEQLLTAAKENLASYAEDAAQSFVDTYLSDDGGNVFGHVKGFDGSLSKMFESESAWDELGEDVQTCVNAILNDAQSGLSYEKLQEWTQGFLFMVEHLVVAEGDYEGYIISTDPNGGTLVDPDPPQNTYAVHPFTHEIWQRIVGAEAAFNALSADAKAYLEKLMTEKGFGLNNGIQPADLPICNFTQLLAAAKKNLKDYDAIGSKLEDAGIDPEGANEMTEVMVKAIEDGAEVTYVVDTQPTDENTVSDEMKEELKKPDLAGYTIKYFEIEVLVSVGAFDPVLASRTVDEERIELGVAKWGYVYAVLREHDGVFDLLTVENGGIEVADGRVYVISDRFSTYALLEKPQSTSVNLGGYVPTVEEKEPDVTSPQTFDGGVALSAAVTIVSATGMVWLGKKKEQ